MSSEPNYQWEDLVDIEDSDLPLTRVLRPCNRHVRETITITSNQNTDGADDSVLSTQEYMKQVVEDVGEDEDFNRDIKTFLKNGKLEQVVTIIKSCSPNALGDLKVTVKDLVGTLVGLIHYKVINEGGYGKEITVFHKDFVPGNGSGIGGSGMLMEEEEIVKLVEEKETADFELHVCGNVIDQEDLYKFDEEALDFVLEKNQGNQGLMRSAEGGGALGANKAITHPLGAVEAACALEVDAMRALDLMEVEAVGALDLVEVGAVGSSSSSSSLKI
ncbi:ribonuclease H-like domain-containing protein [Tanacetum coccineum]